MSTSARADAQCLAVHHLGVRTTDGTAERLWVESGGADRRRQDGARPWTAGGRRRRRRKAVMWWWRRCDGRAAGVANAGAPVRHRSDRQPTTAPLSRRLRPSPPAVRRQLLPAAARPTAATAAASAVAGLDIVAASAVVISNAAAAASQPSRLLPP